MARYFMHLRNGVDELLDPDGKEFADVQALHKAVMFCARDLITGDVRNGIVDLRYRIDAETKAGDIVYTLPFRLAVSIVPEAAATRDTKAA